MLIMKHTTVRGVVNVMFVHTNLRTKPKQKLDLFSGGLVETVFQNRRISTTDSLLDSEAYQLERK